MPSEKITVPTVRIDITQRGGRVLASKEFEAPPGTDEAFLNYKYGNHAWTHIAVRRKTVDGDVFVTARYQGANLQHASANPETPATIAQGNAIFDITVTKLDKSKTFEVAAFSPPRATIVGRPDGWLVTFEPQQYPCVLTVAVDAALTKDEALPSFAFPSQPKYAKGSFLIPLNQFNAAVGGVVRLGIRGAGRETTVKLPAAGKSVVVEPKQFEVRGPSQPEMLTEQYVAAKFNEKSGQITYQA